MQVIVFQPASVKTLVYIPTQPQDTLYTATSVNVNSHYSTSANSNTETTISITTRAQTNNCIIRLISPLNEYFFKAGSRLTHYNYWLLFIFIIVSP